MRSKLKNRLNALWKLLISKEYALVTYKNRTHHIVIAMNLTELLNVVSLTHEIESNGGHLIEMANNLLGNEVEE